jgi:toxin ParE1/3/4
MKSFRFHPEAFQEADIAAEFYKNKQAGLEKRFLAAPQDAVFRMRSNPLIYRAVEGNIRKCRLLLFPYSLIYRVTDEYLEVIAVMHIRKRPGYWKSREIHEAAGAY